MQNIHQFIAQIALNLPEVSVSQPFSPDCDVYKVTDKMFALASYHQDKAMVNLKVEPDEGAMLREHYAYIDVGYYMNKQHWISVYEDAELDPALLQELLINSYALIVSKLKKADKQRIELLWKRE